MHVSHVLEIFRAYPSCLAIGYLDLLVEEDFRASSCSGAQGVDAVSQVACACRMWRRLETTADMHGRDVVARVTSMCPERTQLRL